MTPEEVVQAVTQQSEAMTRPVYRGQADAGWEPWSGAVRRLQKAYKAYGGDLQDESYLHRLVKEYHTEELISPMKVVDGAKLPDLQRLSILQHQGAATGLLDFTEYPLVALWFACKDMPDKDAKVFVLDIGDPQVAQNSRTLEKEDPLNFETGQKVLYYEPDRSLGARIVAQRSVFVICNPLIPSQHLKPITVPRDSKPSLQSYLKQLGLSPRALFWDIPGLAAANTTGTPLKRTSSQLKPTGSHRSACRKLGNLACQAGRYDEALAEYESYAKALPDIAEPHCLVGDTLAAFRRFEDADLAYTRAIENLERPVDPDEQVRMSQGLTGKMSYAVYYNRGSVRAASRDHRRAVADFNMALQYGVGPKRRNVLKNRGNSEFALERFAEAHQDFEAAWLERKGSDAALAMGNCKVKMGEFEEALHQYRRGSAVEPEGSAGHCQANAGQAQRILEALNGCDFVVRREGGIVVVEAERVRANLPPFPFGGNQGNTGNIPSGMVAAHGGEGYEGVDGFAVVIYQRRMANPDAECGR